MKSNPALNPEEYQKINDVIDKAPKLVAVEADQRVERERQFKLDLMRQERLDVVQTRKALEILSTENSKIADQPQLGKRTAQEAFG